MWTPYLNLHVSGKNVSAGINQFCSIRCNIRARSTIICDCCQYHTWAQWSSFSKVIELQLEIQGHFGQRHEKFGKFGEFAGLQCVAIAVYAAAFTCVKQISRWTSDTLDSIVQQGNVLVKSISKHSYLRAEDIHVTVNVYDLAISVSLNFNVHGFYQDKMIIKLFSRAMFMRISH